MMNVPTLNITLRIFAHQHLCGGWWAGIVESKSKEWAHLLPCTASRSTLALPQ